MAEGMTLLRENAFALGNPQYMSVTREIISIPSHDNYVGAHVPQ